MSLALHAGGRRAICHPTVDTRSGFPWKRPLCSLGSGAASVGFGLAFISSFELRMTPPRGLPSAPSTWPTAAFFVFIIKGKEKEPNNRGREQKEKQRAPSSSQLVSYPSKLITATVSSRCIGKALPHCVSICQLVNWPNYLPKARREKEKERGGEGRKWKGRMDRKEERRGEERWENSLFLHIVFFNSIFLGTSPYLHFQIF